MKEKAYCRIVWRIGRHRGHGDWFDISEKSALQDQVDDLNIEHGGITHKLEFDDGQTFLDSIRAEAEKSDVSALYDY
jgi:diadenosine tetraphosphatase ApaH/serine/threonine PP2A family protein phosphatase